MPITFKRAGQEAVTLENVSFNGVALDKVTFKRAGQEAVTVFEKAEPETAVGTWLFKNTVGFSPFSGSGNKGFDVTMTVTDTNGNTYQMRRIRVNYGTVGFVDIYGTNGRPYIAYYSNSANGFSGLNTYCSLTLEDDSHSKIDKTTERGIALRTVTITGGSDATNSDFITWLKANATKQS